MKKDSWYNGRKLIEADFVVAVESHRGNARTVVPVGTQVYLASSRQDDGVWQALVADRKGLFMLPFNNLKRL
jgi:hypothetical protein